MADNELVAVARRFRAGDATGEELTVAFAQADVFCVHTPEPGFLAVGNDDGGFVPMYSSEETLLAAEGSCAFFSAPAATLLPLVPEGYGLVVDLGSDHQVALPSWAFHQQEH
jgi:hypothetical protein